jgi:hypothetical protein
MGRSYLSVKLALLLGVVVAVMVTAHASSVDITTAPRPGAAGDVSESSVNGTEAATEAAPCLWRGCPASLAHPLLKGSMPESIQRRRVVATYVTPATN